MELLCKNFVKLDAFPSSAFSICENLAKSNRIIDFLENEKETNFFPF